MPQTFPRYLCIHGHFYQPPRENPWLEAIEVQDSAAPFHDWNERVTRECYAPNSRARLVNTEGKIVQLLNNYAWMSFNFGPTLLDWMSTYAPEVLRGIVEGDQLSRERRGGHGNALAQVYNHIIMPLASPQDRRTQVLWGIADFRFRFGREPEGMWLAETAVNLASLEALADAGIRFTILAPRQAKRWRRIGESEWIENPLGIDPSRAYRCNLPNGKTIALFFYDGAISQGVAFENLLDSGDRFLDRLRQGFDPAREHPQLVHIATDGESYGHHHRYGDMALAAVLNRLGNDPEIRLTNYGEFLEKHPPEWEVEIHENTSWSCEHGVERWRSNCGCNSGRGGSQAWRAPLRQALDRLKEQVDQVFATHGRICFLDPWAARDAYVQVILERQADTLSQFLQRFAHPNLDAKLVRTALWLLEMQRHALLMFTSCGWFFDEISGLETVQCLRYAARAIQLARHFQQELEEPFVKSLEAAPSNLAEFANGKGVWEQLVRPVQIDLNRVLAHYAISLIHREHREETSIYCFDLLTYDQEIIARGAAHLAIGRLKVRSQLTTNEADTAFVVIHFGGLDFHAVLAAPDPATYEAFKSKLVRLNQTGSLADVTALIAEEFSGVVYHLGDLFVEEQRRIISLVLQDRFVQYRHAFDRLADVDEDVIFLLGGLHYPIPRGMRTALSVSFDHQIEQAIEHLEAEENVKKIQHLLERGKAWGYQPDRELLVRALARQLPNLRQEIEAKDDPAALTIRVSRVLDVAGSLQIGLDLWHAQNELLDAWGAIVAEKRATPALREAFIALADRFQISRDLLGWAP